MTQDSDEYLVYLLRNPRIGWRSEIITGITSKSESGSPHPTESKAYAA